MDGRGHYRTAMCVCKNPMLFRTRIVGRSENSLFRKRDEKSHSVSDTKCFFFYYYFLVGFQQHTALRILQLHNERQTMTIEKKKLMFTLLYGFFLWLVFLELCCKWTEIQY